MPFTVEQFFAVFAHYNTAIWPLQVLTFVGGLTVFAFVTRPAPASTRVILVGLALFWVINAIGYHWFFFAAINPIAPVFAAAFLVQATFLLGAAVRVTKDDRVAVRCHVPSLVGLLFMAYGLLGYAALGWAMGHRYPAVPMFGVAPCPTTIFTIGVLLLMPWDRARWLLLIPFIWSVVGGSAAILLGVPQDFGLILAGAAILLLGFSRPRARA